MSGQNISDLVKNHIRAGNKPLRFVKKTSEQKCPDPPYSFAKAMLLTFSFVGFYIMIPNRATLPRPDLSPTGPGPRQELGSLFEKTKTFIIRFPATFVCVWKGNSHARRGTPSNFRAYFRV